MAERVPDFTAISFAHPEPTEWHLKPSDTSWTSPEGIDIADAYGPADIENVDHLGGLPGIAPPVGAADAEGVAADAHVAEEHFVEIDSAGHLLQGPHLDSGLLHVDEELVVVGMIGKLGELRDHTMFAASFQIDLG